MSFELFSVYTLRLGAAVTVNIITKCLDDIYITYTVCKCYLKEPVSGWRWGQREWNRWKYTSSYSAWDKGSPTWTSLLVPRRSILSKTSSKGIMGKRRWAQCSRYRMAMRRSSTCACSPDSIIIIYIVQNENMFTHTHTHTHIVFPRIK